MPIFEWCNLHPEGSFKLEACKASQLRFGNRFIVEAETDGSGKYGKLLHPKGVNGTSPPPHGAKEPFGGGGFIKKATHSVSQTLRFTSTLNRMSEVSPLTFLFWQILGGEFQKKVSTKVK